MALNTQIAASHIVRDLLNSEIEIDRALASSAALLATMVQARVDTDAPLATGQTAIMRLVRSLSSMTDARGDMVRVHADLLKVGQEQGMFSTDPNGCPNGSSGLPEKTSFIIIGAASLFCCRYYTRYRQSRFCRSLLHQTPVSRHGHTGRRDAQHRRFLPGVGNRPRCRRDR